MDYYKLDKENRWLQTDSPYNIGGRDTDVSQIAYSLEHRIKDLFPINKVPSNLVSQVDRLSKMGKEYETGIKETIELVSDIIGKKI